MRVPGSSLRRCGLAGLCCGDLATVLCTNPSLLELTLTDNELGDSGARELCEGLRHPDCRLKKLEMWGCSLTDSCCEHLSLVLGINQNLLELDLGNNKLGDPGARLLCEGLKHPDCKLQKLMLDRCSLTESGCSDLSSVFCVNHRLTDLDLADNELWDSGVAKLCEGLRHPDCKLQRLGLRSCSLTGSSFAELSSMLCTSSSLTALNLGGNSLHDPAVSQLCEGLKHPGCRIQALELWMCSLTESSCVALSSVLSTSPSLTDLDLSDNEIGDSGVKRLCEGLKHTGCKVQKLRLDDTKLTDDCVPELCAALLEKRDLQRLSLRWNLLTDLSIVFFTPLLETCSSLSELKLSGNKFTDAGEVQSAQVLEGRKLLGKAVSLTVPVNYWAPVAKSQLFRLIRGYPGHGPDLQPQIDLLQDLSSQAPASQDDLLPQLRLVMAKNLQPLLDRLHPLLDRLAPLLDRLAPLLAKACPAAGQACPIAGQACPTAGQACPTAGQACPTAGQACPIAGQACPIAG
ncbi:hypothetical protein NDU88_011930 [Pleurodeles waltl]|uniref:Uncharacterized protein n=1 Tax=Pleurodeles waltl TaxID=8319 RepID=A0AAV7S5R0_PLEWA|nr:hypothetical protein NDU88_011930 [Pleurodeles waltl]